MFYFAVYRRTLIYVFLSLGLLLFVFTNRAQAAGAFGNGKLMAQVGPYVMHWNNDTSHNAWSKLVGAEWENPDRWEVGGAFFTNSFYQPCIYLYAGRRWFLPQVSDHLYVKLTAGPLYGYVGQYESKVPFNYHGLGLAILPALGYQVERVSAQAVILGDAGIIFTFGYQIN